MASAVSGAAPAPTTPVAPAAAAPAASSRFSNLCDTTQKKVVGAALVAVAALGALAYTGNLATLKATVLNAGSAVVNFAKPVISQAVALAVAHPYLAAALAAGLVLLVALARASAQAAEAAKGKERADLVDKVGQAEAAAKTATDEVTKAEGVQAELDAKVATADAAHKADAGNNDLTDALTLATADAVKQKKVVAEAKTAAAAAVAAVATAKDALAAYDKKAADAAAAAAPKAV